MRGTRDESMPAFPNSDIRNHYGSQGMTLRDYFAGCAVLGVATSDHLKAEAVARYSYGIADAMILEREK